MTSTAPIEVRRLGRRYGGPRGFEAVRDVNFSVERGELFALLGTNGAGKTSTMELVEGLAKPNAGTVRVLGRDPYAERAKVRPRIGVMLQEGGFPPDLTVSETARMWAGTLADPRPVAEALTLVDLGHRAAVRVKQLSGGERRRLDLALAILGRPEVLFLDEPTAGLDPESRHNTRRLVRGLLFEGTTVLLTTHYLEEAQELADRLAIMHRGTIAVAGTVAEVVAAHPGRVTFLLPDGVRPEEVPPLPGAGPLDLRDLPTITVHTKTPQRTLAALLSWADRQGIHLDQLNTRSASLEEAFLSVAAGDPVTGGNETTEVAA